MKAEARFSLLAADINDELVKLDKLHEEYQDLLTRMDLHANEVSPYDKAVVGYYLHNFYNGCETIFRAIARFFENELSVDAWHSDLLKRMKLEMPGFRPALIDEELYLLLDDFRAFRHRFRHLYGFELDWEKERLVAEKYDRANLLLVQQVRQFLTMLSQMQQEPIT